jgi:hypothetical protein
MARKNLIVGLLVVLAASSYSQAQPDIALSDTSHSFGDIALGDTASWAMYIHNLGPDTLIVDSTSVTSLIFGVSAPLFPDTVVSNDSLEVTIRFFPSTMDSLADTLHVFSNDPTDSIVFVYLTGIGVAPDIATSDSSHAFGDVLVGDSLDWTLTIYNQGTDTLIIDSVAIGPPQFEIASLAVPDTVSPSDSVSVTLRFLPSDTGAVAGSLWVFSNDPDEASLLVTLSGTGVLQDIALSDSSYDYGDVSVGDSLQWILTIFNEGTADLTIDSMQSTQTAFEISALPLPDTLSSMDSMSVSVLFVPSDTGAVAGSLFIFSNDPDEETLSVALLGRGILPDIALSDTSHDYGDVVVGDSLDWIVTIYNQGSGILTVDSVLLDPSEFEIICTSFPDTIPPSDSIGVTLRFTPVNWGAVAGSLLIFSNDPDEETLHVAVTGNGLAPDIAASDSCHPYGDVLVGDSSHWDLLVFNLGNADLVIDSIHSNHGDFLPVCLSPDTLAPSDTISVPIFFVPSDTGEIEGILMIFSNDPDEVPLYVCLTGHGLAGIIVVSDTSHHFGDVLLGDSLDWELTLFNTGTADLIIDSLFTTVPVFILTAISTPETLAIGDSLRATVTFAPADTGNTYGDLVLISSDPYDGLLIVLLSGRGVTPDISVVPVSLEATTWEGGSTSSTITIFNTGTGLLIFETTDATPWLSEHPDSGIVNPGNSLEIEVIFDAALLSIGTYHDTIVVTSSDPDEPEIRVPVRFIVREAQVIVSLPDAWSLPGDTVTVKLNMDNRTERDDPIAAFQTQISFVDTFVTVLDVTPTDRIDGLFDWSHPEPGRLIFVFATSDLEAIGPDTGAVAIILFRVNPSAMVGDSSSLHFDEVVLSDTLGFAIPRRTQDGTIFLGTGLKGDVNMDGKVNVLDAVRVINFILERIEFTPAQFWAADCNEDGEVNVLDVVGIINVILDIGTCPPTGSAKLSSPVMEFLESLQPYFSTQDYETFMTMVKSAFTEVPTAFVLEQNYPNPFNPCTDIKYQIAESGYPVYTTLTVYNILGQEVKILVDQIQDPGQYTVTWDGRDNGDRQMASGVYFYRLSVDGGRWSESKSMVLMK